MPQALDSASPISPAAARAARAAGHVGWLRYHYNITDGEIAAAHDAGLWVSLIAEFDRLPAFHPPVDAPELGPQHGAEAKRIANAHRFPAGSVIWLTADTMVRPNQFERAGTYWQGAAGPIRGGGFLVGAYGGSLLVDWLVEHGLADRAWECGADSWNSPDGDWRHAVRSRHAVIRQRGGGSVGGVGVDFNDVLDPGAWGQWWPDGAQPATSTPTAPAASPQENDDMAPPLYRFTDGTEFVLVATNDELAPEGFGWHGFRSEDERDRAAAAGICDVNRIVQLQVDGSEAADARFESYPIIWPTEMRRPARGG